MIQICDCRDCGKSFYLNEAKVKVRSLYNIKTEEKYCPYCGSIQWGPVNQDDFLDKYLQFADNGYYNPLCIKDGQINYKEIR